MGVLESPGKVLDFFVSKRVSTVVCGLRDMQQCCTTDYIDAVLSQDHSAQPILTEFRSVSVSKFGLKPRLHL